MDSQVAAEGRLLDIVDDAWHEEKLPNDDINVPPAELPDPEADNGDSHMTLKEQEQKWPDIALGVLSEQNMELPGLGESCNFSSCKQLDFLPFSCPYCHLIYCKDHYMFDKHECKTNGQSSSNVKQPVKYFECSNEICKRITSFQVNCSACGKHYCIQHRHHGCFDKDSHEKVNRRYKKEKWDASKREFEAAKLKVDEQVDKALSQAKTKTNININKMAMKIQLMKLKGKAIGLNRIPSADRLYFLVHYPVTIAEKSKAVFVSKQWALGRVIDAIAKACGIPNRNNELNAKQLRLFHHVDGQMLNSGMENKMDDLINNGIVADGDTLIIEYCTDTVDFHLENLEMYKS